MKVTDDERKTSSQMETIQQHIQNCINSNDRPQKINALLDSWLKVRDLTMACSKEKMILLEPVMAARKRKDLQQFSLKATNILQSWHAYLDGVEGNSKASHSKTVHFVDSYCPCFAESLMSPSEAETTLMMSEGDATAPLEINEEESGQETSRIDIERKATGNEKFAHFRASCNPSSELLVSIQN